MAAAILSLLDVDLVLNWSVSLFNKALSPESPGTAIDNFNTIASYKFKVYIFELEAII